MNSSAVKFEPIAKDLRINDTMLHVDLADGRGVSVPLAWYLKLATATQDERNQWRWTCS